MTRRTTIPTRSLSKEVESRANPSNRGLHAPIPHEQQIKAEADDGLPACLIASTSTGAASEPLRLTYHSHLYLASYSYRKASRTPWLMDPDLQDIYPKNHEIVVVVSAK